MGQQFRLPRFKSGEPLLEQLSAERLNSMLKAIDANRPIIGTNMTGQWSPNGTVLRAKPQIAAADVQVNVYSFAAEVDSVDREAGTVDIHIEYGEINGEPPDGMTGADDYVITIIDDGTEVYAIVTYDTDTFAITSRTIGFGSSVPDSTFGTLNIPLFFVDIEMDGGDPPKIKNVFPHNRLCGDINIAFVTTVYNGVASVWALWQFADPVAIV